MHVMHMKKLKTMSLRDNSKRKQNMLNEEEEKKENNKWANIPDNMLEEIMKRLTLKDYIGLSRICSPWKAIVTNAITSKHCHPLPEFPIILLQSKDSRFFSSSTEREHHMNKPLLASSQTCLGTIEGWLILSEFSERKSYGLSIFFFNPVTNERVIIPTKLNFPNKYPIQDDRFFMKKMKASSKPNSIGSSDCYLVGLSRDFCHIAIFNKSWKSWIMIKADKDSGNYFKDVEVVGTILYVQISYSILVYDLRDCIEDGPNIKPKVLAKLPEIRPLPTILTTIDNIRSGINLPMGGFAKNELGELYFIRMICNAEFKTQNVRYFNFVTELVKAPEITSVQVYKFDMMSEKKPSEWWKRVSLEDHVVFYSGINSMVLSKGALNWNEDQFFSGNSLYFAFCYQKCSNDPWSGFQLGMFCMTDNSTKYFALERSTHPSLPSPFWFIPSIG